MVKFIHLLGIAALALILFATPVLAQRFCLPTNEFVVVWAEKYGEVSIGRGLTGNDSQTRLDFYLNSETGTWTLVVSSASGLSCLLGDGTHWEKLTPLPIPDGIES